MRATILAVVLVSAVATAGPADDKSDRSPKQSPLPLTAPFEGPKAKAEQGAWATYLGKPSPVEMNSIGMELVLIPPGKFRMGSPASERDRSPSEDQVEVTLTKEFYLGKTEVTQGLWRAVMGTTPWKGMVKECNDCPATYVSWDDATEFCKKLSEKDHEVYRLPTEAEWEYACRGGTTTQFSFGDDEGSLGAHAWWRRYSGVGDGKIEQYVLHEVANKLPNPFGLYDMHGNVWEWCRDFYREKLPGGTDPLVREGTLRVHRGGGLNFNATFCRSAFRSSYPPSTRNFNVGFRVARSSGQEPVD